ncbi:hypothetical protein [Mammaliicoccus sciuri]|nr:hypothetical protein [Mammaliicoccus sciuri]MCD8898516.1 hypothetical protein [Mammaliicoccus sciuri]
MRLKRKGVTLTNLYYLGITDEHSMINYPKYSKYKSIQKGYGYDIVIKIS